MRSRWPALVLCTLASAGLYTAMEWLFLVTKPSFMSTMTTAERAAVLGGGLTATVLVAGCLLLPFLPLARRNGRWAGHRAVLTAARLPATLTIALLALLLIDNFTGTVLGWGIRRADAPHERLAYLLLFGGLTWWAFRRVRGWTVPVERGGSRAWTAVGRFPVVAALGALALSIAGAIGARETAGADPARGRGALARKPNILLFSSDGINAGHLSGFGYERETSPSIDRLLPTSLVAENNFPNAAHTGASIASVLTGRLPTETGLIYPPDILEGEDAQRHLPGLLRRQGYATASFTIRHYADAYDLNLRDGFDESNFRVQRGLRIARLLAGSLGYGTAYLLESMIDRQTGRWLHLLAIRELGDPFGEVALGGTGRENDSERIAGLLSYVQRARRPFFVHIHLLATHGPDFAPHTSRFTAGRRQRSEWEIDFYDDAVLTVDGYFAEIAEALRDLGLWDDLLTVVFSDHGMGFTTDVRTPLLFRFPGGAHSRVEKRTTSNLDIAPTVLEYLGAEIPAWMSGRSLLGGEPPPLRPVLSAKKPRKGAQGTKFGWRLDPRQVGPPFYSLGTLAAVICQRAYRLRLDDRVLRISDVEGHTAPCRVGELPKAAEVERLLVEHLDTNGYDVSDLEPPFRRRYSGIRRRDR